MGEQTMPTMPQLRDDKIIPYSAIRYVAGYTADYVEEFAREYALEAVAMERERCAKLCDEQVMRLDADGEGRAAIVAGICAASIRSQPVHKEGVTP